VIIGLIRVTGYLLDRQLRQVEEALLREGVLRKRMTPARIDARKKGRP
jgi:four helix bundle suffix protein